MDNQLKIRYLQKYYGTSGRIVKAIDDLTFDIESGEFVGIMGASGSGKTTLLNCISIIDMVSAGHIYLGDVDITSLIIGSDSSLCKGKIS